MFEDWGEFLATAAVTLLTTALVVVLHYMVLASLGRRRQRIEAGPSSPGMSVMLSTFAALFLLHLVEILLYGIAFWGTMQGLGAGGIADAADTSLLDSIYLSSVTYTTAGYGDVAPTGAIRLIAGTESLVGLMLITWSASFAFVAMEREWRSPPADDQPDRPDDRGA